MPALVCRSTSCDLLSSRSLSTFIASRSSRRIASAFTSVRGYNSNGFPSVSYTSTARSLHYHHRLITGDSRLSINASKGLSPSHNGRQLRSALCLQHIRLYSAGPNPSEQPDKQDSNNSSQPKSQPSSSPPKTPLTATLQNARDRTKSATNALRDTLARTTTRPKNEQIYNLPNFLTVTRLFAAPATAYLLLHDQHTAALLLFAYAGITDLIDGYLARKWNLQTVAGSVMDPMADKALMIIMTATLGVKGLIPASLAALILGRDASLAIAALYYRYASLPAPKTFMRYWDFSLPSAEVHPTTVSKYNTFLQLLLLGSALALPVLTADSHHLPILHDLNMGDLDLQVCKRYFEYVVGATTVWSGLSYAFLKNAVTILGDDAKLKAKQGARGRAIIGVTFGSVLLVSLWLGVVVDEERDEGKILAEVREKEGKK